MRTVKVSLLIIAVMLGWWAVAHPNDDKHRIAAKKNSLQGSFGR